MGWEDGVEAVVDGVVVVGDVGVVEGWVVVVGEEEEVVVFCGTVT